MAEFLTTNGTSYHIEDIIINANEKLYLVSPYLQLSRTLLERLKDAASRGTQVILVYGKNELDRKQKTQLEELKTLQLYFSENLHAKCFFNEEKMVITSMNMYEFSEKNNREMGVLVDSLSDSKMYLAAKAETDSIIANAKNESNSQNIISNKNESKYHYPDLRKEYTHNCIRCKNSIKENTHKPYCTKCYNVFKQFANPFYEESYCHKCGSISKTTSREPLCNSCYRDKFHHRTHKLY